MKKNTIAFDFDNVIHKYRKGWSDGTIYDDLNSNILELIGDLLIAKHPVFILSTREAQQIKDYFDSLKYDRKGRFISFETEVFTEKFWNKTDVLGICNHKAVFDVLIDDRAINFNPQGLIPTFDELVNFKSISYSDII